MKLHFVKLGAPQIEIAYKRDQWGWRYAWLDAWRWRVCAIWGTGWN